MSREDDMNKSHMLPLKRYVDSLRKLCPASYTPYFDPNDAGINAKILFLLEKPGRMTDPSNGGSGFISLDNDDDTARATKKFISDAKIDRSEIIMWNTIPSWNGTRKITKSERDESGKLLKQLLIILKDVSVIILVGKVAQKIIKIVDLSNYHIIMSLHPSPINRASRRSEWDNLPQIWSEAKHMLKQNKSVTVE